MAHGVPQAEVSVLDVQPGRHSTSGGQLPEDRKGISLRAQSTMGPVARYQRPGLLREGEPLFCSWVPEQMHDRPLPAIGTGTDWWGLPWVRSCGTSWGVPGVTTAPGTLCAQGLEPASPGDIVGFTRPELAQRDLP